MVMVMVSVEITLSHQRIEKHERSMMVSVEGKRHQTMKLSSSALKAALIVESCVELCAVHCVLWAVCSWVLSCAVLWAVWSCVLCCAVWIFVLCCELPCLSCGEHLGAKIATALETATPLTYLEEQRALYLSFSWHILETNFSSTQKSTLERREWNTGANSKGKLNLTQVPCVALSWSPCSLYFPCDHIWMGTITNWKWSLHTRHVWFFKNQDPLKKLDWLFKMFALNYILGKIYLELWAMAK